MVKRLSAVVIGTGFIGPVHVESLRRLGINVAGIVGSSPAKSASECERLGLSNAYNSFEEVLVDDSIDVIHLATPNRLHFKQAAAVLNAGKHVLCEKPLAMNSVESAELVRLATQCQLAAGVAYNIRFYPLCHESAARIASDAFGDVIHITGSYTQDWLLRRSDFNWRVEAANGGELRAVADIGTHWLDLVQFMTGQKVVAVCADLQVVHPQREKPIGGLETFSGTSQTAAKSESELVPITTEDAGNVLLKFSGGASGSMHVSQTAAGRKNCLRYEIAGTSQSISWNSEAPNSLRIGNRDLPNESLIRDPAIMSASAAKFSDYPGGHNEGFPDTFKQLFRAFYEYVAAGDFSAPRTFPTFEDGHYEVQLCEAILESHRQQSWIKLGENAS